MTSLPLNNTHGWQRRAWHDITDLGHHTRSDDVGLGMTSPPLGITHDRTTSGMAIHHHLWAAQTVEKCQAWHAIIALERQTRSNDVRRDMPSPPLDTTHGRTSGVTCHHRLWTAHTIERRRAWHAIIALGRQTRSNDIRRDMPSPPLDSTHGRMRSVVAFHHRI